MDKPNLSATCICGHPQSRHAGKLHDKDCTFDLGSFQFCKCKKLQEAQIKPGEQVMAKEKKQRAAKKEPAKLKLKLAGAFEEAISIFGYSKGKEIEARVYVDGRIVVNDKEYTSPSAAANAVTGQSRDGWLFWKFKRDGAMHFLAELHETKSRERKAAPKAKATKPRKAKKAKAKPAASAPPAAVSEVEAIA